MLQKAQQSAATQLGLPSKTQTKSTRTAAPSAGEATTQGVAEDDTDTDDSIGPTLPGQENRSKGKRTGPSIPNMQDLELRRGIIHYEPTFVCC
jgi:hypothetical protein